jgi:hypothetical protein
MKRHIIVSALIAFSLSMLPVYADGQKELPVTGNGTPVEAPVSGTGAVYQLNVGNYSALLYRTTSQETVDAKNSAAMFAFGGKHIVADHASDGFDTLYGMHPGSTAYLNNDAGQYLLTCASVYQGTNTGYDIVLPDGRSMYNVQDGSWIMYTCNDSAGISVTITFWNPSTTCPFTMDQDGWRQDANGWRYQNPDGSYLINTWRQIRGLWYSFDANGYMIANEWRDGNWFNVNGAHTYFGGAQWIHDGQGWKYVDNGGWQARDGWQKIDGIWYQFNENGYRM